MESKAKKTSTCDTAPSCQKESIRSVPATTAKHKNPEMKPVGGKAMTGARYD